MKVWFPSFVQSLFLFQQMSCHVTQYSFIANILYLVLCLLCYLTYIALNCIISVSWYCSFVVALSVGRSILCCFLPFSDQSVDIIVVIFLHYCLKTVLFLALFSCEYSGKGKQRICRGRRNFMGKNLCEFILARFLFQFESQQAVLFFSSIWEQIDRF